MISLSGGRLRSIALTLIAYLRAKGSGWGMLRTISLLLSLLLLLSTTGCLVLAVPTVSRGRGRVIKTQEAAFIIVGQSTREDVVRRLGSDFRDTWRSTAMAYSWELRGMDLNWFVGGQGGTAADQVGFSRWRALFIAFDPNGIVTKCEFTSLSAKSSLDDQLLAWAKLPTPARRRTSP